MPADRDHPHEPGGDPGLPDVTVVVPAFDALPELHTTLTSILERQHEHRLGTGGPRVRLELVAVDDGSTDGTGEVLDAAAAGADPAVDVTVVHIPPSGWAGRPRNVGLDHARGRYVFFCDADDVLLDGALAGMVAFADTHGSDVVLPKLAVSGRFMHEDVWASTQVDADPRLLYLSLIPAKLFRRSLLTREALRFREGRQPLEDGLFVSAAYLAAGRVSILADREYYLHTWRAGGRALTSRPRDPYRHMEAVARIIDTIRLTVPDPATSDAIVTDLYRRKALKRTRPELWHGLSPDERREWVGAASELARTHLPEDAAELMRPGWRRRFRAVRTGSVDGVDAAVTRFEERRDARRAAQAQADRTDAGR